MSWHSWTSSVLATRAFMTLSIIWAQWWPASSFCPSRKASTSSLPKFFSVDVMSEVRNRCKPQRSERSCLLKGLQSNPCLDFIRRKMLPLQPRSWSVCWNWCWWSVWLLQCLATPTLTWLWTYTVVPYWAVGQVCELQPPIVVVRVTC